MKGTNLGEFEELVLLNVGATYPNAYSVAIVESLFENTGRKVKMGVVHAVLNRLEKKKFISSKLGKPTAERGGRRKRFYKLTAAGKSALVKSREQREHLWNIIPEVIFQKK